MTIVYLSGNSLTGSSGDTKPNNVAVNSTFLETDTNKTFKYTGSSWVGIDVGVGDSVSNAELDGSINYNKLSLTGSILNSDLAVIAPSVTTTQLDFGSDQLQTISISANTTFTTTGLASGKSKTIKITTDGTLRTLTFPAWKFVGSKPANQAASKIGILTLTSFGTTDAECVAAYAVEA